MNEKINIYFLGSGKIGIPSLKRIYENNNFELVGVGTQEDRTGGRKNKIISTPVALWAEENGLKVDKIKSVNTSEFLDYLNALKIDIILVASFGQLLKENLLNLPKIDCINVHASILPKYRGASPLAAAILNGDEKTGVSIMKMEKGLDSGPVYSIFEYTMNFNENAEMLEDILGELAAENIEKVLVSIFNGSLKPVVQENTLATHVGKIRKDDGNINWNLKAIDIERMIRGYYSWPGAFFYLNSNGKQRKIQLNSAEVVKGVNDVPGNVIAADKNQWIIACGEDALRILKLVPEGKNEMTGPEFLRGCTIKEGTNINNEQ